MVTNSDFSDISILSTILSILVNSVEIFLLPDLTSETEVFISPAIVLISPMECFTSLIAVDIACTEAESAQGNF